LRYVYVDIFFLINFCFNFFLLYLTGRLARAPLAGRRLTLAAALGGLYSVASLYPELSFLMSLPARLLASGIMVAVAFPTGRPKSFAVTLGLFYLGAFVVGGAALAWSYLVTGSASAYPGSGGRALGPAAVLPAALAAGALLHWAVTAGRERGKVLSYCVPCRIVVGDLEAEFPALIDTGNRLRDPLSDSPVLIVEYPAVGSLLPPEFGPLWDEDDPTDEPDLPGLTAALGGSPWSSRLRVIPFSSLGRASGLLVGFRPDAVVVGPPGQVVRRTDVVVCLSPRPLSAEGSYRALAPPEILQQQALARAG